MGKVIAPLMALCKKDALRGAVGAGLRLAALDVGDARIGVATCDAGWRIASPLSVLARRGDFNADMDALFALLEGEGNIGGLIIGWPRNMDGSEGPRCDSVRDFTHAMLAARKERGLPDIPCAFVDERLSTAAVERDMLGADLSRARRAAMRDALAAAWILQGYIDGIPA